MPETPEAIRGLADTMITRFTSPSFVPGCEVKSVADISEYATNNGWIEAIVGGDNQQRVRYYGTPEGVAVNDFVDVEYFPAYKLYRVFGSTLGGTAVTGGVRVSKVWESDFGSVALQADADGNVLIGTGSSTDNLQVEGASGITAIASVFTGGQFVELRAGSAGSSFGYKDTGNFNLGMVAALNQGGVDTLVLVLDTSARVGVGAASTSRKIEIYDDTPYLRLKDNTTGTWAQNDIFSGIEFYSADANHGSLPGVNAYIHALHTRTGSGHNFADAGLALGTMDITGAAKTIVTVTSTGLVGLNQVIDPSTALDLGAGAIEFDEMTAPAAGAANTARLFARDDGGGDTELCVRFNSGLIQVIAPLEFGEISRTENTTLTALTVSTPAQYLFFDTNGPANGAAPDHTNDHVTIAKTGTYLIVVSISAESVAGSAYDIQFTVEKNNGATLVGELHAHRTFAGGGGDFGSVSLSGLSVLTAGDTIELWVVNQTSSQDIRIEDATLSVTMVGVNA